ncbi:MAG: exodeoxyribonuclease VII small subunit [Zoogloeaceae bacterium]|jgi:exodeoxyribonuclease VII small subunit|nr:exodeoxyribonuclease VII small subunit [Zoogloeaceae bacterium]
MPHASSCPPKAGVSAPPDCSGDLPFEAALAELEGLLARLERGEMELEASIEAYQRGMLLLKHCQRLLSLAKDRVKVVEEGVARDFSPEEAE